MIDRRTFTRVLSLSAAAAALPSRRARALLSSAVKPKHLEPGDRVAIVSPASAAFEDDDIAIAKELLEAIGLQPVISPHAFDRHGYFAGRDEHRAKDLNRAFADRSIAGIFCYTGGWGSARLLPLLDYDVIRRNPKVLIGYSDITALLNAIYQETGLITFHGPVASSSFDTYSLENFRNVVMTPKPAGMLAPPPKRPNDLIDRTNRVLRLTRGKASGRLVGGNLTIISTLMGTPWELDTRGAIVFLEDVREDLYRIDRMLTQLALAGKFDQAAGVVFGRCSDCGYRGPTFSLEEILRERFGSLRIPAVSGLSFGHIEPKLTLPVGARATLDADAGTLTIDEAAVQ
ncbi:MAG TPA: LD-carboxypeptidase [Thermoanaerobaculia bacterium]|nr:LD-carboxypeptidase [Thermoanaerobaculia bacterium]